MAESKKAQTIKKITEIPNATVTIEVEEKADESTSTTTEVESINDTSETQNQTETESNSNEDSTGGFGWKKAILMILIVVPIGFLMVGGLLYYSKNLNLSFLNTKKTETKTLVIPVVKSEPTKAVVDKKAYVIEIQNGSGIAGEGAKVKETLETAGFKVVTVTNADNSNYTDTIIKVSSEVKSAYIDELSSFLKERGSVGKTEKLATGEDGQVIVILGSSTTKVSPTITP